MLDKYYAYIRKVRDKLRTMGPSSTKYWKLSKSLLHKSTGETAIPALKRLDGTWARSATAKAQEFATFFLSKWIFPAFEEVNEFSIPWMAGGSASG